ncbi:ARID DNA-binding domain-containing protein, partial [Tanacetum coccineum]
MVNTNTFLENRWSRPSSSAYGLPNIWYQSKLGRPLRKKMQYGFIQRQLKREREREARLGNCIRQITNDCKDMLRKKLEEIEMYNSTISQNRNRKQKCYKCRQRGHIIKNCPLKEKKQDEGTKKHDNTSVLMKGQESANLVNKELLTTKPTISLKYPEWIHFSTKCMIKGTDQGHWDDIWIYEDDYDIGRVLIHVFNLFAPAAPVKHDHHHHNHTPQQHLQTPSIQQPLDFPTQKHSGFGGGIGLGNTVQIDFCASCSY